jgi:hypothetical protein
MINANKTQRWLTLNLDWYSGLIECGCYCVDRDRVIWICSVCRDVTDDGQLAVWRIERGYIDEVGDLSGEVDAVNEDVALNDL